MSKEDVKQFFKKIGGYIIAFLGGVASFCVGTVLLNKRNRTDTTREQLEHIQSDSDRLADTNRSTEEILATVRERKLSEDS